MPLELLSYAFHRLIEDSVGSVLCDRQEEERHQHGVFKLPRHLHQSLVAHVSLLFEKLIHWNRYVLLSRSSWVLTVLHNLSWC